MTLTLFAAYGQALAVDFVYRDTNAAAINITGYSAEFQFRRPDGSLLGALLSTTSGGNITNGGVNGTFGVTVPEATIDALSTVCGNPPRRAVSWRMVVTPGGGDPIDLGAGALRVSPEGTAIVSQTVNAVTPTYQTTVTAIGSRGPTGPTGPQGPAGQGGKTAHPPVTVSTVATHTLGTVDVAAYRGGTLSLDVSVRATRAGVTRQFAYTHFLSVASNGTVTKDDTAIDAEADFTWGAPDITLSTDTVTLVWYANDTTSTTISAFSQPSLSP